MAHRHPRPDGPLQVRENLSAVRFSLAGLRICVDLAFWGCLLHPSASHTPQHPTSLGTLCPPGAQGTALCGTGAGGTAGAGKGP